ncbi:hypothetical protein ACQCX2_07755 [Propionibacteriaceae bacterium Y1700]|uniref:hypothetical protein n=1 Tax=Microlunatus sp. Y1700 TaxID=3418487 RepID=UPI003DA71762
MTDTITQLRQLPGLAAECWLTWDAPNPAPRASEGKRTPPGSKPPTDLSAWDALRPDEKGQLAVLASWARLVAEERDNQGLTQPEPPANTWAACCDYLIAVGTFWAGAAWRDELEHEVAKVWRTLRTQARTPPEQRYKCTHCGGRAHMRDGGSWLSCEDCGKVMDHRAEIARAMATRPPMTRHQIAAELGVPVDTVKKRITRYGIEPERVERGRKLYDIERVQRRRVAVREGVA